MAFVVYGLVFAILAWAAILVWRWIATAHAEAETFAQFRESGELLDHVDRADFRRAYLRSEGPVFGTFLLGSTLLAMIGLPIMLILFNAIWRSVWLRSGQSPVLELGQLPHLLTLAIVMVGALFCIAFLAMRIYHRNRPRKLRREITRLNGDVNGH